MIRIANISITKRAAELLDCHRVLFKPRDPGDVFALTYMSSFTNADGTSVAGFAPGYTPDSIAPVALSDIWALAQPLGAPEFLFMPRFVWSASALYGIDIASEVFQLFSIEPVHGP